MVNFWWGIDFLLWDIDFFGFMGIFGHVGFGYGKFLWTCDFGCENFFFFGLVILGMGIFWTCDFGHVKFFWTCGFGHGN